MTKRLYMYDNPCTRLLYRPLAIPGIDAAYLSLTLEHYLNQSENMPKQDWFLDPLEDHQAWAFREAISTFQELIVDKEDEGNGEEK